MRIVRILTIAALLIIALTAIAPAGEIRDELHINAIVKESLKYTIQRETSSLRINKGDLKKGYKHVANGTMVRVATNNPDGYVLVVRSAHSAVFSSVLVQIRNGQSAELIPGGTVEFHIPYGKKMPIISISYNFNLVEGLEAGVYDWPILVTVSSL